MDKLVKRIPSGLIVVTAITLAAFCIPSLGVCILLATISTLALLEFYHLLGLTGIPSFRGLGVLFGVLIIIATWASHILVIGDQWEPVLLAALVVAVSIRQLPQKRNGQPLATVAGTVLGVLYVPLLFNYFTKLVFSWEPPGTLGFVSTTGRLLFFYLLAVVKLSDVGAYLIGSRWGRHKLIPRISPGKTWEGCFGGIGFGFIASLVFFLVCRGQLGCVTLHGLDAVVLGVLLPTIGMVGDLTESVLKRTAGVKDSSSLVPGLGGALDILDSLLFAVPVLYVYTAYVLAPSM